MKNLKIRVYGRVQGVFYRISTQREAEKLDLCGFVRNLDDGSVEIEIEGDEDKLQEFLAWCRKGPVLSKVAKVDYSESDDLVNYGEFEVKKELLR